MMKRQKLSALLVLALLMGGLAATAQAKVVAPAPALPGDAVKAFAPAGLGLSDGMQVAVRTGVHRRGARFRGNRHRRGSVASSSRSGMRTGARRFRGGFRGNRHRRGSVASSSRSGFRSGFRRRAFNFRSHHGSR